jgi:hypothetical protein
MVLADEPADPLRILRIFRKSRDLEARHQALANELCVGKIGWCTTKGHAKYNGTGASSSDGGSNDGSKGKPGY